MSERKECADRIKDMFHVPCCSHNICLGCSSGQECTAISPYKSVVIRLKEWKILLLVCNLKPITLWSSIFLKISKFAPTTVHFLRTRTGIFQS